MVPPPQTPFHLPLFYRWAGRVIGAAAFFYALLNKGADHTNKELRLCLWQSRESDFIDICAVHARAPLPSKP